MHYYGIAGENLRQLVLTDLPLTPEMIEINGQEFALQTYLWRDFMPGTAKIRPLQAVLRLQGKNGAK